MEYEMLAYFKEQFIVSFFTVLATLTSSYLIRRILTEKAELNKEFVKLVTQVSYVLDMYANLYTNGFDRMIFLKD